MAIKSQEIPKQYVLLAIEAPGSERRKINILRQSLIADAYLQIGICLPEFLPLGFYENAQGNTSLMNFTKLQLAEMLQKSLSQASGWFCNNNIPSLESNTSIRFAQWLCIPMSGPMIQIINTFESSLMPFNLSKVAETPFPLYSFTLGASSENMNVFEKIPIPKIRFYDCNLILLQLFITFSAQNALYWECVASSKRKGYHD